MAKNTIPSYQREDYPYQSEDSNVDLSSPFAGVDIDSFYEMHCPNPDCDFEMRCKGTRAKEMQQRLVALGCPDCKLQFDDSVYQFKDGERIVSQPFNQGKYQGFIVRRIKNT